MEGSGQRVSQRFLSFFSPRTSHTKSIDATHITRGPISFVLVLTFLVGALTHAMHLHPLLGAFIVGVLLRGAPRVSPPLAQSVQTMTLGLFGPVFFVFAGMRVDLTQLGGPSAIITIILLLVVASLVKIGFGGLGALLGGLGWWEAASVGVGLNLKGGTDVIVAVVGSELGFLSGSLYTTYAVVAMLTVLISPPLLTFLSKKAPPSTAEAERLAREEMAERAYLQRVERVLTPVAPPLFPALVADVVACIATTKQAHNQVFDVTRLDAEHRPEREPASSNGRTPRAPRAATAASEAAPAQRRADAQQPRDALAAAKGYDLVAIGARPPQPASLLSLGRLNDRIINNGQTDVLVVVSVGEGISCGDANRILAPINGLEHSMAAIDVAACLARHNEAEVVLFHVARPLVATWAAFCGAERRVGCLDGLCGTILISTSRATASAATVPNSGLAFELKRRLTAAGSLPMRRASSAFDRPAALRRSSSSRTMASTWAICFWVASYSRRNSGSRIRSSRRRL